MPIEMKRRRWFLIVSVLLVGAGITSAEYFTPGQDVKPYSDLKTGEYVWVPNISPTGPVVLVVSIPKQEVYVYRNGVRVGRSTVSTGMPGHPTPTGVFTILEKQVDHTSTIYKGAEMPYMERLTWGGIALHAGVLPGYAHSHGCVRLPLQFAKKLYTITAKGCTVIITDSKLPPEETQHPGYLLTTAVSPTSGQKLASEEFRWTPEDSPKGPVSIVFSAKSSRVFVFRNGVEIGRAVVRGLDDLPGGLQAFTALDKVNPDGWRQWITVTASGEGSSLELKNLASRLQIPPTFLANVRSVVEPGTTLVLTDVPITPSTYTKDTGMNVMVAGMGD